MGKLFYEILSEEHIEDALNLFLGTFVKDEILHRKLTKPYGTEPHRDLGCLMIGRAIQTRLSLIAVDKETKEGVGLLLIRFVHKDDPPILTVPIVKNISNTEHDAESTATIDSSQNDNKRIVTTQCADSDIVDDTNTGSNNKKKANENNSSFGRRSGEDVASYVRRRVVSILQELQRDIDIYESYSVEKYINVGVIAVKEGYRGRGIASELVRRGLERGKDMGGKVAVVRASGEASQTVFLKSGFEMIRELIYKDYFPDLNWISEEGSSCQLGVKLL